MMCACFVPRSEQVSPLSLNARVWPRACAVAERLWSDDLQPIGDAATRLARHRCRMAAHHGEVGPIWADYCSADYPTSPPPRASSSRASSSASRGDRLHATRDAAATAVSATDTVIVRDDADAAATTEGHVKGVRVGVVVDGPLGILGGGSHGAHYTARFLEPSHYGAIAIASWVGAAIALWVWQWNKTRRQRRRRHSTAATTTLLRPGRYQEQMQHDDSVDVNTSTNIQGMESDRFSLASHSGGGGSGRKYNRPDTSVPTKGESSMSSSLAAAHAATTTTTSSPQPLHTPRVMTTTGASPTSPPPPPPLASLSRVPLPPASSLLSAAVSQGVPIKQRVQSLDVFRGFNIALMIFVDMVGASFPVIHHSPWNGIRLADFVMPFFDFMVGVSLAISLKRVQDVTVANTTASSSTLLSHCRRESGGGGSGGNTGGNTASTSGMIGTVADADRPAGTTVLNTPSTPLTTAVSAFKWTAFRKATVRFVKIFVFGVVTQGGVSLVQFNLAQVRIMGILQRVAVCYYAVAVMEIFLPQLTSVLPSENPGVVAKCTLLMYRYRWQWAATVLLVVANTAIMYGVDVVAYDGTQCGKGDLTPLCNAASYVDRMILGVQHMYV